MIFDALTLAGILSAVLAGGFLVVMAYRNDTHRSPRNGVSQMRNRG
jgi:hypothetical protein